VVSFDATMQMQLQVQQIIEQHRQQLLRLLLQLHCHFLGQKLVVGGQKGEAEKTEESLDKGAQ
jgi:hypothetical protein